MNKFDAFFSVLTEKTGGNAHVASIMSDGSMRMISIAADPFDPAYVAAMSHEPLYKVRPDSRFQSYSVLITGDDEINLECFTINELREGLRAHLREEEIKGGALMCLMDLDKELDKNGYVENRWRNFSVRAYPIKKK